MLNGLSKFAQHGEQLPRTAAHPLTLRTRGQAARRYATKWQLIQMLYCQGWSRQRLLGLFAVLDWMLYLPPTYEHQL